MNQNPEYESTKKEEVVLICSTYQSLKNKPIHDDSENKFFCIPSVPRPGFTSWSLVL